MIRTDRTIVRFVVNADDLGLSSAVNDAIFTAIEERVITSSTLMANAPAFDEAARLAKASPAASFGVHLNLTDFPPLTATPSLVPLLDASHSFKRGAVYAAKWRSSLLDAVVDEWVAQVRRVQQSGIAISHLDSHHHVHTIPGIFFALKRVQRATGIQRVRGTWSIYDRERMPSFALRLAKRLWRSALRHVHATRTTDEFSDILVFLHAVAEGSYRPRRWPRTIELMTHPSDNEVGKRELAALRSGWMSGLSVAAALVPYSAI